MPLTNSKQQKILEEIFSDPTPNDILWTDIESLLKHVGCRIEYRGGSKVRITKNGKTLFEHRPHPGNQTPSHTTKRVRDYLTRIGVTP